MMKITAEEKCNTFITNWEDLVVDTFSVTGETMEECFKKIYPRERSLRYCSGYWIELQDKELHKKYTDWKRVGVTIEMYYGNGTVD